MRRSIYIKIERVQWHGGRHPNAIEMGSSMLPLTSNGIGLILSYALIGVLFVATRALTKVNVPNEINRKFLHIAISHWWLIATVFFDSVWVAILPPITFIIANYLARRYHLIEAMQRKNEKVNCSLSSRQANKVKLF